MTTELRIPPAAAARIIGAQVDAKRAEQRAADIVNAVLEALGAEGPLGEWTVTDASGELVARRRAT